LYLVCFSGKSPFKDIDKKRLTADEVEKAYLNACLNGQLEVKLPDGADGDMRQAYQLIEQMLILDPSKRITAKAALRHPWLAGLSVADVPDQCHQ